mmetsp:Transcript_29584/g.53495  ORF Transcript_29584/g.53495 Transcript_29584/m.53495 type:complete len:132 (+) Transcript_29584:1026-1421(+)
MLVYLLRNSWRSFACPVPIDSTRTTHGVCIHCPYDPDRSLTYTTDLSYLSVVGTIATVAVVLSVFLASMVEGHTTEKVETHKSVDGTAYHLLWNTAGLPLLWVLSLVHSRAMRSLSRLYTVRWKDHKILSE